MELEGMNFWNLEGKEIDFLNAVFLLWTRLL